MMSLKMEMMNRKDKSQWECRSVVWKGILVVHLQIPMFGILHLNCIYVTQ